MFVEETGPTTSFGVFGFVNEAVHKFAHHTNTFLLVLTSENEDSRRAVGAKHIPAQRTYDGLAQTTERFRTEIAILAEDAFIGFVHVLC